MESDLYKSQRNSKFFKVTTKQARAQLVQYCEREVQ